MFVLIDVGVGVLLVFVLVNVGVGGLVGFFSFSILSFVIFV